ncbi:MAG: ATP-binding protein [Candidatus Omnitrophica bacterium]|nr:ATP-binding protein [Candidatus Omnitrophota bacterium]
MRNLEEKFKITVMAGLLIAAFALTCYFLIVVKTDVIYTHLFYIPIILSAMWWGRRGVLVAVFLAIQLLIVRFSVDKSPQAILHDSIRSFMFIFMGFFISVLSDRIQKSKELLERAYNELEAKVKERTEELSKSNLLLWNEVASRKKAQGALQEAYSKLKETQNELIQSEKEAALGRFSLGISHEVKNPLSLILGGAEYLETKLANSDENIKANIVMIKKSTLRANDILEGILQYLRPSSFKVYNMGLNGLVGEIMSLFKLQSSLIKMEITAELSTEDIRVNVNKNQMHQVIFNIVKNAIEASQEGGKIAIKTDASEGFGVISVIDNGSGMSKETLANMFEPFFTTKRPGKGTGLGLVIVKTIIDRHNGKLLIESEEGKGTTVKIMLPLAK